MNRDIKSKLNKMNLSQDKMCAELGMGRNTIFRLAQGKDIYLKNFIKLIEWLGNGFDIYMMPSSEK
jgi:transcriptional regulator with XRE-family HTH domain